MDIGWNTTLVAGNETWRLVCLFGVILVAAIGVKIIRTMLIAAAQRLEGRARLVSAATLLSLARSTGLLITALTIPVASRLLIMDDGVRQLIQAITGVLGSVAVGYTLYQLVDVVRMWMQRRSRGSGNRMDDMLVPIVQTTLRVTIVVLTLLQVAQSLTDKPLTSIIAGLGVGGLAVALAAQDTIKHFFGSIVLFADKPFQIGERVTVDGVEGNVEEVGFRSTRIRTLEGHLVTLPNGDLANKMIINVAKRPFIRHRAIIGITYDTPPEKVETALATLRELLADHPGRQPDFPPRVAFHEYGPYSLNILVMFWFHPPDYWQYIAYVEQFNLQVLQRFNAEGIDFAFPTQTLYLAGDPKRALKA
jgi:MscS family membrane protein